MPAWPGVIQDGRREGAQLAADTQFPGVEVEKS